MSRGKVFCRDIGGDAARFLGDIGVGEALLEPSYLEARLDTVRGARGVSRGGGDVVPPFRNPVSAKDKRTGRATHVVASVPTSHGSY